MSAMDWLAIICPAITATLAGLDWADRRWPPRHGHGRHEARDSRRDNRRDIPRPEIAALPRSGGAR